MIIDCILINDEIEFLCDRILYLKNIVDKFVIYESTKTFSNKEKKLYCLENINVLDKLGVEYYIHTIDNLPDGDAWKREEYTRNCFVDPLLNIGVSDTDIILMSDVDEIPKVESIVECQKILNQSYDKNIAFVCKFYYYYSNTRYNELKNNEWVPSLWTATRSTTFKNLKEKGGHYLRYNCNFDIKDAGWHFSYLSKNNIRKKLESFSHTEFDFEKYKNDDYLNFCFDTGEYIFGDKKIKIIEESTDCPDQFIKYSKPYLNFEYFCKKSGTDKQASIHNYSNVYEKIFCDRRYNYNNILEIGIATGNSLRSLKYYFPKSKIFGVDCDFKYLNNSNLDDVTLIDAEAPSEKFFDMLKSLNIKFDIIIDDASHISKNMIEVFENCFEHLNSGGIYIIEDIHATYYENKSPVIDYFNNLNNSVHIYGKTGYGDKFKIKNDESYNIFEKQLFSITNYQSLIIIEKINYAN